MIALVIRVFVHTYLKRGCVQVLFESVCERFVASTDVDDSFSFTTSSMESDTRCGTAYELERLRRIEIRARDVQGGIRFFLAAFKQIQRQLLAGDSPRMLPP